MSAPTHPTPSQPPQPTQQPRPKRRRRTVLVAVGVGLVLAIAAVGVTGCGTGQKAAATEDAPATTAPEVTDPDVSEGFPEEGIPEDTKPETIDLKVGDVANLSDVDTDEDILDVTITKAETINGEEYNEPERGHFLGVYVKVKALADDQSSLWGDFYVVQNGHHYDADGCCPDRFEPSLDYVDLNTGEVAEGWLVFDVPAKHGKVVLGQSYGGGKIATWTF
jgi:hypothetical protein